jgi:hypothetical protein
MTTRAYGALGAGKPLAPIDEGDARGLTGLLDVLIAGTDWSARN